MENIDKTIEVLKKNLQYNKNCPVCINCEPIKKIEEALTSTINFLTQQKWHITRDDGFPEEFVDVLATDGNGNFWIDAMYLDEEGNPEWNDMWFYAPDLEQDPKDIRWRYLDTL